MTIAFSNTIRSIYGPKPYATKPVAWCCYSICHTHNSLCVLPVRRAGNAAAPDTDDIPHTRPRCGDVALALLCYFFARKIRRHSPPQQHGRTQDPGHYSVAGPGVLRPETPTEVR